MSEEAVNMAQMVMHYFETCQLRMMKNSITEIIDMTHEEMMDKITACIHEAADEMIAEGEDGLSAEKHASFIDFIRFAERKYMDTQHNAANAAKKEVDGLKIIPMPEHLTHDPTLN